MKETEKKQKQKVAIFDIDGTIFRSSLLIELTDAFIQENIFPLKACDIYKEAYKKWNEREGSYQDYIQTVVEAFEQNIKGVNYDDFIRISKKVISANHNKIYLYTKDLVKELKDKNYFLLAISNSPKAIVEEFCKTLGFNKTYGRMYEVGIGNKLTGAVMHIDLISDKAKILERAIEKEELTLDGSVGVGDTESDIPVLEMVKMPICFNPNKNLYDVAKKKGWKIVVERKDVIYNI